MKIYSEKNINEIKLSYEDNKMNTKQKKIAYTQFFHVRMTLRQFFSVR